MNPPSVLIVGTGALATLFAARFAAQCIPVIMLGTWQQGLEALNQNGVCLQEADGTEKRFSVTATDNPNECLGARNALVLVKSWQTARAAGQLRECLADEGLALSLQNGLGNQEILSAALGAERVALGVTTTGATLLGPGLARAGGEGQILIQSYARISQLSELLKLSGFNLELVADARALVWGKLIINAAINPLTALLGVPNGELLKRPAALKVLSALASEGAEVARALNIQLPFSDPVRAAEDVARQTEGNISSMLQDIRRGAPTEIDAICGAIVRAGKAKGISTSANWMMWQLVLASVERENESMVNSFCPLE